MPFAPVSPPQGGTGTVRSRVPQRWRATRGHRCGRSSHQTAEALLDKIDQSLDNPSGALKLATANALIAGSLTSYSSSGS